MSYIVVTFKKKAILAMSTCLHVEHRTFELSPAQGTFALILGVSDRTLLHPVQRLGQAGPEG